MPSVMTMAVRTIACGSGSLICPSGSSPTIGGPPGRAARHQEQQVGAVADEDDADEHARQAALEQQVDARGEQHADGDDEDDVRAHVDHGSAPSRRPVSR